MDYYTAEYEKLESKCFAAEDIKQAKDHAKVIGYGDMPTNVRLATSGEIELVKERYKKHVDYFNNL